VAVKHGAVGEDLRCPVHGAVDVVVMVFHGCDRYTGGQGKLILIAFQQQADWSRTNRGATHFAQISIYHYERVKNRI
jgi:hypothetical protein